MSAFLISAGMYVKENEVGLLFNRFTNEVSVDDDY